MVRLSDLMENETYMPDGFGLVVFGELASKCLEEDDAENKAMEGLCPSRIELNDDWYMIDRSLVNQAESSDLWFTVIQVFISSSVTGFSKPHWNITRGWLNQ